MTPEPPITACTRLHCFKKLQLSRLCEYCLNYQLWPFTRKSFKLKYPINTKISAIFAEYQGLNFNRQEQKWLILRYRKTTKITFLPSVFYWNHQCSHCGWLLLKCSAIGIGFNGAETNCGIAHILGILLKNSYEFKICSEARISEVCPLWIANPKVNIYSKIQS